MVVIGLRQGMCDWRVLFADRDAQLGQLMTWQITIVTGLELATQQLTYGPDRA